MQSWCYGLTIVLHVYRLAIILPVYTLEVDIGIIEVIRWHCSQLWILDILTEFFG